MLVFFRVSWTCLILANKTLQIELQPSRIPCPILPLSLSRENQHPEVGIYRFDSFMACVRIHK